MSQLDFSKLSLNSQKTIFTALVQLEDAFSQLETVIEDTFDILEEELVDFEDEHGQDHPLAELLGSLKAHVEEQNGNFDLTGNFSPAEKRAFLKWWDDMRGGHFHEPL